jgi:hypothetical protein
MPDLTETDIQVGIVYCRTCAHCASAELAPGGVPEVEYVIPHDLREGVDNKFNRHAFGEVIWVVGELRHQDVDSVSRVDVGVHANGVNGEEFGARWQPVREGRGEFRDQMG